MRKSPKLTSVIAVSMLALFSMSAAMASETATMTGATYVIGVGERASFPVRSASDQSSEFVGWCELKTAGSASIVFDARHYVPLSEPAVGDVINFNGPGERRFEMTGTFEANDGASEMSFFFANVPVAFCFGGGDCASVGEGSATISVSCGQN
ncbi:MAG: hypothetical protein RLN89_00180 [Parvibaculum sp.]